MKKQKREQHVNITREGLLLHVYLLGLISNATTITSMSRMQQWRLLVCCSQSRHSKTKFITSLYSQAQHMLHIMERLVQSPLVLAGLQVCTQQALAVAS